MIGILTLSAYYIGSRVFAFNSIDPNIPLGESMAFATLALSQLVHAFNIRSSHSLFRVGFHHNRYMLGAFLASCILMLAVLVLPFLQGVFEVIGMTERSGGCRNPVDSPSDYNGDCQGNHKTVGQ